MFLRDGSLGFFVCDLNFEIFDDDYAKSMKNSDFNFNKIKSHFKIKI